MTKDVRVTLENMMVVWSVVRKKEQIKAPGPRFGGKERRTGGLHSG